MSNGTRDLNPIPAPLPRSPRRGLFFSCRAGRLAKGRRQPKPPPPPTANQTRTSARNSTADGNGRGHDAGGTSDTHDTADNRDDGGDQTETRHQRRASHRKPNRGAQDSRETDDRHGAADDRHQRRAARNRHNRRAARDRDGQQQRTTPTSRPKRKKKRTTTGPEPKTAHNTENTPKGTQNQQRAQHGSRTGNCSCCADKRRRIGHDAAREAALKLSQAPYGARCGHLRQAVAATGAFASLALGAQFRAIMKAPCVHYQTGASPPPPANANKSELVIERERLRRRGEAVTSARGV